MPVSRRLLSEPFLTAAEQLVRQIYFRSPAIQHWRAGRNASRSRRELPLSGLKLTVERHGVRHGDTLMVHSSLSKITVIDDLVQGRQPLHVTEPPTGAALILETLREAVGEAGTIVLPTFPKYENEPEYLSPQNDGRQRLCFDPARTPSKSGLLTEVFRQSRGSVRSRFPIQTVSANGPLAVDIVRGNANGIGGLVHGPNSPYGRLVAHKAWVISIGIPLIDFCTVVHAAEDARYQEWPVKNFWRSRDFDVVENDGVHSVTVLERRPIYSRGYAEELLRRDVRADGILGERMIGNVECHALRADRLFDLMTTKNAGNTYPFLWPAVSRL